MLAFIGCLLISGCQWGDDSWSRISDAGVLRVGLDPTYPPFENADTGQLEGLDVDLALALGHELGLRVDFVYFGFDGLYDALATEQADVLISALVVDPSRTRDFAYSEPYFNAGQVLVIHEDQAEAGTILSMADLRDRMVAVELGTEGHIQALNWERRVPNLTIRSLNTADDALWVVLQNEVDAAVVDSISGRLYVRRFPDLHIVSEPVTVEPYAVVVQADDQRLLQEIDRALLTLKATGQLDSIAGQWLD